MDLIVYRIILNKSLLWAPPVRISARRKTEEWPCNFHVNRENHFPEGAQGNINETVKRHSPEGGKPLAKQKANRNVCFLGQTEPRVEK